MKRIFYYLPSIIFNVVESLVIILIGVLLGLEIIDIMIVILLFASVRMATQSAIHYKSWKLCLLWSTLQMFSLFLVYKTGITVSVIVIIFAGIVLSGKGDISDIFMWGGNNLNNEVFNWVKFNQDNDKLKKYETQLKETDKQKYYIFEYRFREFKSFSQIANLMDMNTQRISEEIKVMSHFIEYSIRLDN